MNHSIEIIFVISLLLTVSVFASLASTRLGTPLLLIFLIVGTLFGEEGPGGIVFNDMPHAYMIGSLALAVVLFDGGLRTPVAVFRKSMWPAISLSTLGVLLTTGITGAAIMSVFHLEGSIAFLLGAILASTDAAAVFLLLNKKHTGLKMRVKSLLEVESGINDPMAVFLTMLFVEVLSGHLTGGWPDYLNRFAWQMSVGISIGYGGGRGLAWLVNRLPLTTGLFPVLVLAGSMLIFSSTALMGASGFLAVYLAGLIVGNSHIRKKELVTRFYDGIAWLAQITMFIMIGLLVVPSQLMAQLGASALIAMVLFVARPAAVVVCLAPFRYSIHEVSFIAWVGLRGAVPIFLAIIPTLEGLDPTHTIFNVTFTVVVISLLVQGWTVFPAGKCLGLVEEYPAKPPKIPAPDPQQ